MYQEGTLTHLQEKKELRMYQLGKDIAKLWEDVGETDRIKYISQFDKKTSEKRSLSEFKVDEIIGGLFFDALREFQEEQIEIMRTFYHTDES